MGDEVRAVSSLSGGESFLVSLALALGLASLSSETTQVETLFIDEGFGTLDPETLEVALATLDALQATGRQVGIISHVSGLAERIGVQVRVVKQGAGRSRLQVVGEAGLPVPGRPRPGARWRWDRMVVDGLPPPRIVRSETQIGTMEKFFDPSALFMSERLRRICTTGGGVSYSSVSIWAGVWNRRVGYTITH
ncbi:SbcC/MukB-like Walker B domain-containing protein [Cystobacter fuscus]